MTPVPRPALVLASSSSYRKALLERLGLPFSTQSPDLDESALPGEKALDTALRLAEAKARAVASAHPGALVIGSDQVALLGDIALGKPGNHPAATGQLRQMSGRTVVFHSAVCLFDTRSGRLQRDCVQTTVTMRRLSDAQIERYLLADRPYDCAGSAKIEALGITLAESVESSDPTALIGLPLIALTGMLARCGVELP